MILIRRICAIWAACARKMPVTFWVYLIGALALAGIAPLSGFFSKDEILAAASAVQPGHLCILLILAAFLTAFYMGRQILMVFFGATAHPRGWRRQ